MSKRNRSTAKITKWFTTQAKNDQPQESTNKDCSAQESVCTETIDNEVTSPFPSQGAINDKAATPPSCSEQKTVAELHNARAKLKLLTEPNQPRKHAFPSRTFGKQDYQRSFQASWFEKFKWLHYDADSDSAFCFTCIKALQHNMISSAKGETAFTETGFQNWKRALAKGKGFNKHESSECHKEAAARLCEIPATVKGDIGEMMSTKHALEKLHSRKILLKILGNIRYLARQALPLRGDWKESENSEADSNFYQLLKLRCDEDPLIVDWLQKKTSKFISADIQNEMLEIMALRVLREIAQNIQNALI